MKRTPPYFWLAMVAVLLQLFPGLPAWGARNASQLQTADAATPGKRVALVIGNGVYLPESRMASLGNNPGNDAEDIGKALKGFGFEVEVLKNATRRQMNEALRTFGEKVAGSQAALFYFAGHGIQVRGENFIMPTNADASSEAAIKDEGVSVNRVLDELEGSAAVKIVMLDACRDNPVTGKFRSGQRGLAPATPPKGTVIAYATAPGETAANSSVEGRNGLFTTGLLKAFKGEDLSLDGVLTVASAEVELRTERVNESETPSELI